jgi:hypothetical protein
MFEYHRRYLWLLPVYEYANAKALLDALTTGLIDATEKSVTELRGRQPQPVLPGLTASRLGSGQCLRVFTGASMTTGEVGHLSVRASVRRESDLPA